MKAAVTTSTLLETAVEASRKAGDLLKDNFGKSIRVDYKGRINLVTELDFRSESLILRIIRERFPEHDILTEESRIPQRGAAYRWIIDPLDGTTSYAHGYPFFAVSIGVEVNGKSALGVVYNPLLDELFHAVSGGGSFLNGKTIHVSETSELDRSLLSTGFPYNIRDYSGKNLDNFNRAVMNSQGIRRDGSAALDLCHVASGRNDGFWERGLLPWDVAAGSLLVTEAGGRVTDFRDNETDIFGKELLATNGLIHGQMVSLLE